MLDKEKVLNALWCQIDKAALSTLKCADNFVSMRVLELYCEIRSFNTCKYTPLKWWEKLIFRTPKKELIRMFYVNIESKDAATSFNLSEEDGKPLYDVTHNTFISKRDEILAAKEKEQQKKQIELIDSLIC